MNARYACTHANLVDAKHVLAVVDLIVAHAFVGLYIEAPATVRRTRHRRTPATHMTSVHAAMISAGRATLLPFDVLRSENLQLESVSARIRAKGMESMRHGQGGRVK